MPKRERIIHSMCLTFNHSYMNEITEEDIKQNPFARSTGMLKAERESLFNSMAQIFDNDIAPNVTINYPVNQRLKELFEQDLLPRDHVEYLYSIQDCQPRVIYDIGACVMHWTRWANQVWPQAELYLFEAMNEAEFLYQGFNYEIGVFSDVSNRQVEFFKNVDNPGGNSYYRENPEFSWGAKEFFTDRHKHRVLTKAIDDVVTKRCFKLPDLIKIDVQGCELDVMKGMDKCLTHAKDLIIEMQQVQYNEGAPLVDETTEYIKSKGFTLIGNRFSNSQPDAPDSDYHFRKI